MLAYIYMILSTIESALQQYQWPARGRNRAIIFIEPCCARKFFPGAVVIRAECAREEGRKKICEISWPSIVFVHYDDHVHNCHVPFLAEDDFERSHCSSNQSILASPLSPSSSPRGRFVHQPDALLLFSDDEDNAVPGPPPSSGGNGDWEPSPIRGHENSTDRSPYARGPRRMEPMLQSQSTPSGLFRQRMRLLREDKPSPKKRIDFDTLD